MANKDFADNKQIVDNINNEIATYEQLVRVQEAVLKAQMLNTQALGRRFSWDERTRINEDKSRFQIFLRQSQCQDLKISSLFRNIFYSKYCIRVIFP